MQRGTNKDVSFFSLRYGRVNIVTVEERREKGVVTEDENGRCEGAERKGRREGREMWKKRG